MAESTEISIKQDAAKEPFNVFSILPKFNFQIPHLNLQLPFLKPGPGKEAAGGKEEAKQNAVVSDEAISNESLKPDFVRFPKRELIVPPPLETEAEEQSNKTSNPIILWQVYALGGFLVLKWVWARWNERRGKGTSSDDDDSSQRRSSGDSEP
ncbi:hypothetical protein L6164_006860 [Bauhinia variegata]|uniref:Uncharacterized protein n=1 Tax=Bauhinia variegata TaxID=167791 RepID=A0ACB9PVS1_BAUVA|nr:hypothetical protein L6164_006860 [Bauhinia variegata]